MSNVYGTIAPVAFGYCWCGCGSRTSIAKKTNRSKGWIKGQPKRFILGHNALGRALQDLNIRFWSGVRPNVSESPGGQP
jgi:hypothetical protein